jgi:hypothetical protein
MFNYDTLIRASLSLSAHRHLRVNNYTCFPVSYTKHH